MPTKKYKKYKNLLLLCFVTAVLYGCAGGDEDSVSDDVANPDTGVIGDQDPSPGQPDNDAPGDGVEPPSDQPDDQTPGDDGNGNPPQDQNDNPIGGGNGGDNDDGNDDGNDAGGDNNDDGDDVDNPPQDDPGEGENFSLAVPTQAEASAFLMAASFGPTQDSIEQLVDEGYIDWVQDQLNMPFQSIRELAADELITQGGESLAGGSIAREAWYDSAVLGEDQLRQRAAFALSQIFVVSSDVTEIQRSGTGLAEYMDIIQRGAFGNFRDLLEEVTYNPMMAIYLTYLGNGPGNPDEGTFPDENYARELMQLFSIGLIELNPDASQRLDNDGVPLETYTNEDIMGLSRVFTGLWYEGLDFSGNRGLITPELEATPLQMNQEFHSDLPKTFLGQTIPGDLPGEETISRALDVIFAHPNVAPFISKQLIQRMTTSNPSPDYIERVVDAFESGEYTFANGEVVGSGERGDMRPVWAAILLDQAVLDPANDLDPTYGKVREPIIRFIHWARFANIDFVEISNDILLSRARPNITIGQSPYRSPSVFNFYRPGYVDAGSQTAAADLVAPELQISSGAMVINYANFMNEYVRRDEGLENNRGANNTRGPLGFAASYDPEVDLADDPEALVDRLNLILTAGRLPELTQDRIIDVINSLPLDNEDDALERVRLAVLLVVNTPDFIAQK